MTDLIDRISGHNLGDPPRPRINAHAFQGAYRLYALGLWTRAQIATAFELQGQEATQATQIADAIDAITGGSATLNKVVYINRVDAVLLSVNDSEDNLYHNGDGTVNKTLVFSHMLIAG